MTKVRWGFFSVKTQGEYSGSRKLTELSFRKMKHIVMPHIDTKACFFTTTVIIV